MIDDDSWESRTVQRHGSENQYYRMSLPPEFAEGKNEVKFNISGDTLIVKNNSEPDETELFIEMDQFRSNSTLDIDLLLEILPSWAMANYDRVKIQKPDNEEEQERVNNLLKSSQKRPYLEWNEDEFCLTLEKYAYADLVKDIDDFLDLHFMATLQGVNKLEYLQRDFTEEFLKHSVWPNQESPHSIIRDDEEEIDIAWSLTSKNAAEVFWNVDLENFPKAVGKTHAANKLERCIDHAFVILALFHDSYNHNEKLTKKFRDDLCEVFLDPSFNEEVRDIGMKCFSEQITTDDVIAQKKKFKQRQSSLYNVHQDYLNDGNLLLGEIVSQCYELIRCPRSLAIAGLGNRHAME